MAQVLGLLYTATLEVVPIRRSLISNTSRWGLPWALHRGPVQVRPGRLYPPLSASRSFRRGARAVRPSAGALGACRSTVSAPRLVWGLGFRVWGLGFGVWGLGSRVWGLGFGV